MQSYKERPLSRHENQVRLLFVHADEVIRKLEMLNTSAGKLEHLAVMINGAVGAPGVIEVVESLAYELNKVERRCGRALSRDMSDISERLTKIESFINEKTVAMTSNNRGVNRVRVWVAVATALLLGSSVPAILYMTLVRGMQ